MARLSPPPLAGQIININSRTISREVIGGGGGRGVDAGGSGGGGGETERGGAIIVRPQTSLIDRSQNLQIQTTQQSVGYLQQSLDFIRVNVQVLSEGINNLGKQLQAEGVIEQRNLKEQQESERRLSERQIRLGRESQLERKITAALSRPIVAIQKNITSLFDRIMGAMTTLFFGWLTNQGIETLKSLALGDSKKLEEIKNNVIKNILYSIGAFAAINVGFGLVMRTLRGLTFRIISLGARLALAPFRSLGSAIARIFGGKPVTPKAPKVPITTSGGKTLSKSSGFFGKFFEGVKGLGKSFGAVGKGASRLIPFVNIGAAAAATAYDVSQGNYVGATLSAASALPGPFGWAAFGGRLLYGATTGEFGGKQPSQQSPTPQQSQTKPRSSTEPTRVVSPTQTKPQKSQPQEATPSIQPQVSATPQLSEITMSSNAMNNATGITPTQQSATSFDGLSSYSMPEFTENADNKPQPTKVATPSNIQSPPKPITPVGTLPEPKPNIIIAGGGQNKPQVMSSPQQEPLTDVPFIPSGNTDNFYVLYSQLNYNVVM
jgi:hypothetical protein